MADEDTARRVRAFYEELPFNYSVSASVDADAIRSSDTVSRHYSFLLRELEQRPKVLDLGCGAGWLANSLAYHHQLTCTGVDLCSAAVVRARDVSLLLKTDCCFIEGDLFSYEQQRFDLVFAMGVLHHTGDVYGALEHIARHLLAPRGLLCLGLYHSYGRAPFLEFFRSRRKNGASEDDLFRAFEELNPPAMDQLHCRSWFRDQVLHPHETQHTLKEIWPVLTSNGMELEQCSINRFGPFQAAQDLFALEESMYQLGRDALLEKRFFPGFFIITARLRAER